jgi:hypothetical protein
LRRRCEETTSTNYHIAAETCENTMDYVDEVGGGVFTYDARIFDYDWAPVKEPYLTYLNSSAKVQDLYKAIHIDNSPKKPVFEAPSQKVYEHYAYEIMEDYTQYFDFLMGANYKTLVYAGQWDSRDGPITIEPWLRNLRWLHTNDFFTQNRKIYYYKDTDGSTKVGGYYRQT